jgi:hypothetical protein
LKNCVASKKQYKHLKSKDSSQDESLPCSLKKQHGFLGRGKFTTCEWLMVLLLLELPSLCGLLDLQLGLFFSVHRQKWKVKIDGIKF